MHLAEASRPFGPANLDDVAGSLLYNGLARRLRRWRRVYSGQLRSMRMIVVDGYDHRLDFADALHLK
jgi:hypothetical protein